MRCIFTLTSSSCFGRLGSHHIRQRGKARNAKLSHGNDHHISAQQHFLNGTFSDWTATYLALDFFRLFNVIIPQIYHQSYLKTSYFSKYKWLIPFRLRQDPETLSINFFLSHCLVSPSSISSYSYAWKYSAIIKHTDSCGSLYFQKSLRGNSSQGCASLTIRQWDFSSQPGKDYSRGRQRYGREWHRPKN